MNTPATPFPAALLDADVDAFLNDQWNQDKIHFAARYVRSRDLICGVTLADACDPSTGAIQ